MARNTKIIKSSLALVAAQNADEAFLTSVVGLRLYGGIQDVNYSVSLPHQELKQVGSQGLVFNAMTRQPDVELEVSFYAQPWFSNECNGKFVMETPNPDGKGHYLSGFHNMFSGMAEKSTNFYVFIAPSGGTAALHDYEITFDEEDQSLSGFDAIAFGNCYPKTYGLRYGVGELPIVSTSYICSNILFENITGESMQSPAINLTGGNNDGVKPCSFNFSPNAGYTASQTYPPILYPTNSESSITLQNLQVGGQNISGTHFIQALDLSVDLPRVSNYGLGNDFPYERKAQFPANGRFSVSSLVSGLESGVLTEVLNSESGYNFQLVLAANIDKYENRAIYQIEGAKLNSFNYGMTVNGRMSFDAEFSFEVTEEKGLKLSGWCDSTVFH